MLMQGSGCIDYQESQGVCVIATSYTMCYIRNRYFSCEGLNNAKQIINHMRA